MQTEQFHLHADIEQRHWWFVARRQILSSIVGTVLPPSKETTIVDVGCGTGANLAGLADSYDCVGIDTSADAVRLAAARFPQVQFIRGFAPRDLGDMMDRAHMVLLTDVLEHVPDDFQMLSELMASARAGTYFLITVPADMGLWSEHDRAFGHYRRYDLERFEQIWWGLPARLVFSSYFNSRLYPVVKAVRRLNRWRGKSSGAAGTDFRLPSRVTNHLLTRFFAGERKRLTRLADGRRFAPYHRGVSLIALLEREAGTLEPRSKPCGLARDYYDPVVDLVMAEA